MTRISDIPTSRLSNFFRFQRDPLGFLVDALPMGDVVSLRTSSLRPTYIVNSPDFVQEILVHQEQHFRKGRTSGVLRRTIGDGLLTAEHSVHKEQKKVLMPVFYKERIQTYAEIVQETEKLADSLVEGVPVPMHDLMMQLTLGIIARSLFRTELSADKEKLAAAVDITIRQTAGTIFSPIILPFSIPTPGHLKHKQAIRTLEAMIYKAIANARKDPSLYSDSMLGLLLDTRDEAGNALPEQEIRDQMMTMLLAGHETTANALVWAWNSLEQVPATRLRLHEELDQIQQGEVHTGKKLSAYERYREMPFTKQVIQETLRLYPPAWAIMSETERDITMLGDRFKVNSSFLIIPYAIHRNDKVFGDAAAFRPERFDEGLSQWPKFTYFPFGGGSRGCIGSQFALLEAGLILGSLARRFIFMSSSDQGKVTPEPLVSLRMKEGLWMIPHRRRKKD